MKNYDLNKILPQINRKSERHDEGRYYDLLRLSPFPVVISGGQSGVDSMSLKAASFLGLPAFAFMPKGGKREGCRIEDFQKSEDVILRKIEFASESYRFRTYANVWLADVTIIYDFVGGSEGTNSACDACRFFERPYIVLENTNEKSSLMIDEFLKKHQPNIINVAGNSLSKITNEIQYSVFTHLKNALKRYAFFKKAWHQNPVKDTANQKKLTIAIPNISASKNIFADFLSSEYDVKVNFSSKLVYDTGRIRLVTCRPREIINLVKNGVDVGFVGEDLCMEYDYTNKILLDTGLIPNSIVLVGKYDNKENISRICSQYPYLAKKLTGYENILPITGSAEAYLSLGIYDFCIDSYQTGNTTSQNALEIKKVLDKTSLVMIGEDVVKHTDFFNHFLNYIKQ